MNLTDLIGPDRVILGLRGGDKAQLLAELAREAAARTGLDQSGLLAAIAGRELLGSTGLGRGFALPHARVEGLGRLFGLFARLARPVAFDAIDGQPVDLVFLLLIPAASEAGHLAALAAISREMRQEAVARGLRRARNAGEICALFAGTGP